jgi:hypothetical protein
MAAVIYMTSLARELPLTPATAVLSANANHRMGNISGRAGIFTLTDV